MRAYGTLFVTKIILVLGLLTYIYTASNKALRVRKGLATRDYIVVGSSVGVDDSNGYKLHAL